MINQNLSSNKKIAIIILSFNDERIARAINSVIKNDMKQITRIIVVDGGSNSSTISIINSLLRDDDILVSENDEGIFDGLNKGIDIVTEDYFGWLGSDDHFPHCNSFFDKILFDFSDSKDAVVLDCHMVSQDNKLIRITKARSKEEIIIGKHNGHFSTFLKTASLNNLRFDLKMGSFADILFFLDFFTQKHIDISFKDRIGCFQEVGGVSNATFYYTLSSNFKLFRVLLKKIGFHKALQFLFNKLFTKINFNRIFFKPTVALVKKLFIIPFPLIESFVRQFFIFRYKMPEPELRYIKNNLAGHENEIALDVGAAEGYFSYNLSKNFKYVHAFEPHPDHLKLLKPFRHKNIICHNIGLSNINENSKLKIPINKNDEVKHEASLRQSIDNFEDFKIISVECKRLDDYFLEQNITDKIGFIKIDVEGFENEVIDGAKDIIKRDTPLILCEIELRHNNKCHQLFDYLASIGYKSYTLEDDENMVPFNISDIEHFQSADRLAYRLYSQQCFNGFKYINNFFFVNEGSKNA